MPAITIYTSAGGVPPSGFEALASISNDHDVAYSYTDVERSAVDKEESGRGAQLTEAASSSSSNVSSGSSGSGSNGSGKDHVHGRKLDTMEIATSDRSPPSLFSDNTAIAKFATTASWLVNWFLLLVKIYIAVTSSSKAILAALVDSAVDLVSQAILDIADRYMTRYDADYPVGRARLEALSVLACAFIMTMASIEVVQYSVTDLYMGINGGKLPELTADASTYGILGVGIFLKFFLWLFCRWSQKVLASDLLEALAEDHFNDVISNTTAICTLAIALGVRGAWWVDAAGAIGISVVIIVRWMYIGGEQVKKIVGHTAPPAFVLQVEELARQHDSRLSVDCTRAYHFGARYNVEMEIVLPGRMTVMESHDIALALQHKIEELADVERAFVHVDHEERDGLEHKVERELVRSTQQELDRSVRNAIHTPSPGISHDSRTLACSELRVRKTAKTGISGEG